MCPSGDSPGLFLTRIRSPCPCPLPLPPRNMPYCFFVYLCLDHVSSFSCGAAFFRPSSTPDQTIHRSIDHMTGLCFLAVNPTRGESDWIDRIGIGWNRSGVHGLCGGVYVRVSNAAVARRAAGEAARNDDPEVTVPVLPGEGPSGEYRQEAQVTNDALRVDVHVPGSSFWYTGGCPLQINAKFFGALDSMYSIAMLQDHPSTHVPCAMHPRAPPADSEGLMRCVLPQLS